MKLIVNYPTGAIRTQRELQDVVTEARREKKAIRLYQVSQGGYFKEMFLTSKSKIFSTETSPHIKQLAYHMRSTWSSRRYYPVTLWLADNNVTDNNGKEGGYNRHMLFTNRKAALAYSEQLKNDKTYQAEVKAWHDHCSRIFRMINF